MTTGEEMSTLQTVLVAMPLIMLVPMMIIFLMPRLLEVIVVPFILLLIFLSECFDRIRGREVK